jgi:hypothetical protein
VNQQIGGLTHYAKQLDALMVLIGLIAKCQVSWFVFNNNRVYCTIQTDCSCHVTCYIYCSSDKLFMSP